MNINDMSIMVLINYITDQTKYLHGNINHNC